MLRLKHCAEWLYYGFWHLVAWHTLDLPRWLIHGDAWLRQPFLWVVTQGWVFSYLPTLAERKEIVPPNVKANRARASRQPRSEPAFRALRLSGMLGDEGQSVCACEHRK